jgi:hypothetical protein
MGTGRRKKRLNKAKNKFYISFLKVLVPIAILLIGATYFWLNIKYWNGQDKLSIVSQGSDGNVSVKIFDPSLGEVTTLVIPGDTEVSVSRNLGTLRIKNVWQLGINEMVGGKLLAETVTKNFLFPTFLFQGPGGETNIPLGDNVLLWIFEKRTKNLQRTEINLGEAQYLKRQRLSDGDLGYVLVGEISERLTVYFSDPDFSAKSPGVYIKDNTGTYGISENVGQVIEVMGGKVVTIEKGEGSDIDCFVSGNLAKKVARVFNCKIQKDPGKFDLEITLGREFAKRF